MALKKTTKHSIGMSPEAIAREQAKVKKPTEAETVESLSQELNDANAEIERLKAENDDLRERLEECEQS